MSDKPDTQSVDRARLQAALEAELTAALPSILKRTIDRYLQGDAPDARPRTRSSRTSEARALLDELLALAKREDGELERRLDLPFDALLAIANGVDRTLAARFRRSRDAATLRVDLGAELRRRATRYDVFLTDQREA